MIWDNNGVTDVGAINKNIFYIILSYHMTHLTLILIRPYKVNVKIAIRICTINHKQNNVSYSNLIYLVLFNFIIVSSLGWNMWRKHFLSHAISTSSKKLHTSTHSAKCEQFPQGNTCQQKGGAQVATSRVIE